MQPSVDVSPSPRRAPGDELSGSKLESVLRAIRDAVIVESVTGEIVWANEAAATMLGVRDSTELLHGAIDGFGRVLIDESGRPLEPTDLPAARLRRSESVGTGLVGLRDGERGRPRWAAVSASIVDGTEDEPRLVATIWRDVTDDRSREWHAYQLARATNILSGSLDYTVTLQRLAQVLVPDVADWYCADVLEGGELRTLAVEHVDPRKAQIVRALHGRMHFRLDDARGLGAVVRTGRSELVEGIADELLVEQARGDAEVLGFMRELGACSMMIVPLKAYGRTFGGMKLLSGPSGRRYDEDDLACAEELGRRIGIAIENARLYREAREAVRLRDEFLVVAGHELRTPLAALKLQLQGVAGAIHRGQLARDPETWIPRMDTTLAHANRLQQLIDRLLDVSHIASQRVVLDRQEMDLADSWRSVIERHAREANCAGCVVSFESKGPTTGCWDRARVDQVLSSLLGNALKYGAGKPVSVLLEGEGCAVKTFVRDEGVGIDLAAYPRIFERFERAVSVRNYGGFGLGLWIVRELVEAHGGTVGFESRAGLGSTFWLELPRSGRPT
jgi:signal transduction histidine kinase